MKISKWVDMGQEVEVEIGVDDVRSAMCEAFGRVVQPEFEEYPTAADIKHALNDVAIFLKAITDDQIVLLGTPVRKIVNQFLEEQAARFADKKVEAA